MRSLVPAILLVVLATAVSAQNSLLPLLYDVSDVAPDDVLNVRDGPGADYPIFTTLSHDAKDIEVVQFFDGGKWGLIGLPENHGWVSMDFLTVQPGQDGEDLPRPIACFGTEPFWGLILNETQSTYVDPASPDRPLDTIWQGHVSGRQPSTYGLILGGDNFSVNAIISRNICTDGMSDRAYGFEINTFMSMDDRPQLLTGCCSLR